jgi:hypothetical protein
MPGPVALEDANRIDQAIVDIERLRQEIQMAPGELIYLGILGF